MHVIAEKAKVYQARMNKLKSAVNYVDVVWLTTLLKQSQYEML